MVLLARICKKSEKCVSSLIFPVPDKVGDLSLVHTKMFQFSLLSKGKNSEDASDILADLRACWTNELLQMVTVIATSRGTKKILKKRTGGSCIFYGKFEYRYFQKIQWCWCLVGQHASFGWKSPFPKLCSNGVYLHTLVDVLHTQFSNCKEVTERKTIQHDASWSAFPNKDEN